MEQGVEVGPVGISRKGGRDFAAITAYRTGCFRSATEHSYNRA